MKPKIGITIGDQAGIGLEIIEKTIPLVQDICEPIIIGQRIENPVYGKVNADYGRIAGDAIKEAVDLAQTGGIDAIVTAPLNKEALNLGGYNYSGHTEMLADLIHTQNYAMMLAYKNFRVIHATTHIAFKDIIFSLSIDRIFETMLIAKEILLDLGILYPFIAVAGLNPHCSDGGLFGDEEEKIIQPAINRAIDCGIRIAGEKPISPDIVFCKAYAEAYDCIVAMYHDQGHIPLKFLGFKWDGLSNEWGEVDGVNITCGLSVIRTSPDHGVAFGKAGQGIADPTSMLSAVKIAVQLVEGRKCRKNLNEN